MVTWPQHLSILGYCHCQVPIRDRLELLRGHSADDIFNVAYRAFEVKGQLYRSRAASEQNLKRHPSQLGSLVAYEPPTQPITKGTSKNRVNFQKLAPTASWGEETERQNTGLPFPHRSSRSAKKQAQSIPTRAKTQRSRANNDMVASQYVGIPQAKTSPFYSKQAEHQQVQQTTNRRNRYTPPGPLHVTKAKYRNANGLVSPQPHLPIPRFSDSMPSLTPTFRLPEPSHDARSESPDWSSTSGDVCIVRIPGSQPTRLSATAPVRNGAPLPVPAW
jgi:hypothetical protein